MFSWSFSAKLNFSLFFPEKFLKHFWHFMVVFNIPGAIRHYWVIFWKSQNYRQQKFQLSWAQSNYFCWLYEFELFQLVTKVFEQFETCKKCFHIVFWNKTASYGWHIFRLYILVKTLFKRMKAFFKHSLSSSYFLIFPNLKVFWFFARKPQLRWKRHFHEIISFDTQSTASLPFLTILKKFKYFFRKRHYIFSENPNFWTFWKILLVHSYSTANLLQFGD